MAGGRTTRATSSLTFGTPNGTTIQVCMCLLVPVQHIAWSRDRIMGSALTIMSPHIASQLPNILQ